MGEGSVPDSYTSFFLHLLLMILFRIADYMLSEVICYQTPFEAFLINRSLFKPNDYDYIILDKLLYKILRVMVQEPNLRRILNI